MEARLIDRLPMLPGYSLPEVKERYPLSHTFDFRSGMPVARSLPASVSSLQRQPPPQPPFQVNQGAAFGGSGPSWGQQSSDGDNNGGSSTRTTHHRRRRPVASKDNFLPNFALNDKKVLHFQGYFREEVDNSPFEQYRVRPVDIFYFLEDDSVSVREPKQENSGLSQGCIVRRHRIRRPDGSCFHWSDFNVGSDLSLYGVTYRLINCDKFTRDYLRQRGVFVRGPEPLPEDPYTVARRSLSQHQRKQHTTKSQRDKLWRFLRYDRHVLRFFCVEDGPVDPRHRKKLVLQYFLVDDTLDLKELHRPLEQRELAPILLGRQRVPKVQESRGLFHVYETDGEGEEYIGPEDLLPGRRLNLYGRSFLIYDCDDFTKNFYRENFGTDNFDVVDVDVRDEERPTQPIPPYNGFGSPEDTLQSVFRITPRLVRRNSRQALEKEGIVLRFQATLDSAVPLDKERSFVICFYPSDETVSILERPLPNSGMPGGKFLRRMRLRKPAQPGTAAMEPHYYDLSDFRVGNVLEAVGRRFVLVRADQFAASYIKRHQLDALANGPGTTDNLTVNGNHRPMDALRTRQDSRLS